MPANSIPGRLAHFSIGIAVVLACAGFASAADAAMGNKEQLVVVERATSDTTLDLGAKGDSVGDVLTFSNEIYDKTNKTKIGSDNGYCVRIVVGKAWECIWTLMLEKGQLTVEGPFLDAGDSMLAITGGSGAYANARGDMLLHARDAKGSEYEFTYNIVR